MKKITNIFNINNIVITVFILLMASASTIAHSDIFFSFSFIFFFVVFIYKKRKIDLFIVILFLIWLMINVFSYFVNEALFFKIETSIGITMKIFLPYLMVKIVGVSFFQRTLKYIYYLVLISTVFYIIDMVVPSLYDSLSTYLNLITMPEQKLAKGWYIFLYMHSGWASDMMDAGILRNSGFMWEPGGYSMILIIFLLYHLSINNFTFDKIALVLLFGILTTFSTSGFLALMVIAFAYAVNVGKKVQLYLLLLIPIIVYLSFKTYQLDFIAGKIDYYAQTQDKHTTHKFTGIERVNRFGILKYNFEQALRWPFGNGSIESLYLFNKYGVIYRGPNTFAGILYIWGFGGIVVFLYLLYLFYKKLNNNSKIIAFCSLIATSMVLFSNPEQLRPIIYIIIFYYILHIRNKPRLVFKS